jgi:pimeloyl-[acyl-carrier protein] synthase
MNQGEADLVELASYIRDPSALEDPYPLLHRVQAAAPVHWNAHLSAWVVLSYTDALEVFRNPQLSREAAADRQTRMLALGADREAAEAVEMFGSSLMMKEGEDHARLRRLIVRAFSPRAIAAWQPMVEEAASELVGGLEDQHSFDFITAFAYPLPERVICRLLGVPVEDHELFTEWDAALTHTAVYAASEAATEHTQAAQAALVGYREYFDDLIGKRRGRVSGNDLLSLLIEAEDAGDRLSREELIGTLILLIVAGHHTTANLLGNGVLGLLRHPDQIDLLQQHPDRVGDAVEELLRYDSSARGQLRIAIAPTTIGAHKVATGDTVIVVLHAVDRDPARFADPDRLEIDRKTTEHLAFAAGPHYCVGAALARLEGRVGLTALLPRLGDLELTTDVIRWKPTFGRAAAQVPLKWRRSTTARAAKPS